MGKNIKNTSSCHKYGTAFPIKNAGRPKGSKTNKKPPELNDELKDEVCRKRFKSTF